MIRPLEGKVALITGGGTGIGAAIARRFANSGASVVVTGRRSGPIEHVAKEIGGIAVSGDVTDSEHLSQAVGKAVENFGGLDIVVANAGISAMGDVGSLNEAHWQRALEINVTGVMRTAGAALPALIERGGGSIVNISSVAGLMGGPYAAGYCTSKSAILGLTKSMAIDYGPHGIRVNTLCPGWTKTPMSEEEMAILAEERGVSVAEAINLVTRHLPLKRMAEPEEIAACAQFLASDDASFVTGTVLVADGGGCAVDVGTLAFLPEA